MSADTEQVGQMIPNDLAAEIFVARKVVLNAGALVVAAQLTLKDRKSEHDAARGRLMDLLSEAESGQTRLPFGSADTDD